MSVLSISVPDNSALLDDFDEETARKFYAQGEEIVVWVMLQLAALAKRGETTDPHPSTPSSSIPVYEKEPSKQRHQKSVAKQGHRGVHRPPPQKITHHQE